MLKVGKCATGRLKFITDHSYSDEKRLSNSCSISPSVHEVNKNTRIKIATKNKRTSVFVANSIRVKHIKKFKNEFVGKYYFDLFLWVRLLLGDFIFWLVNSCGIKRLGCVILFMSTPF